MPASSPTYICIAAMMKLFGEAEGVQWPRLPKANNLQPIVSCALCTDCAQKLSKRPGPTATILLPRWWHNWLQCQVMSKWQARVSDRPPAAHSFCSNRALPQAIAVAWVQRQLNRQVRRCLRTINESFACWPPGFPMSDSLRNQGQSGAGRCPRWHVPCPFPCRTWLAS